MQKIIYTVLRFGLLILMALIYWNDSAEAQTDQQITVQAGDTWQTLAMRFDTTTDVLREANTNVVSPLNPLREPLIGVSLSVPRDEVVFGRIHHPNDQRSCPITSPLPLKPIDTIDAVNNRCRQRMLIQRVIKVGTRVYAVDFFVNRLT